MNVPYLSGSEGQKAFSLRTMADQFIQLPVEKAQRIFPILIEDNEKLIAALHKENEEYRAMLNGNGKHLAKAIKPIMLQSTQSEAPAPILYSFAAPVHGKASFILSEAGREMSIGEICKGMEAQEPDIYSKKGMKYDQFRRNVSSTISQKIKDKLIFYSIGEGLGVKYGLLSWKNNPEKTTVTPQGGDQ